jgi:hypothetical protein
MLHFTSKLVLHICARKAGERERWVAIFARLLENFNATESVGGWVGTEVIETETVVKIEHWYDGNWALTKRVLRYFKLYQQGAEQEAVSLELTHDGRWQAWVIFENDWAEVEQALYALLDEDGQALALADWFDEQAEIAERRKLAEIGDPSAVL